MTVCHLDLVWLKLAEINVQLILMTQLLSCISLALDTIQLKGRVNISPFFQLCKVQQIYNNYTALPCQNKNVEGDTVNVLCKSCLVRVLNDYYNFQPPKKLYC